MEVSAARNGPLAEVVSELTARCSDASPTIVEDFARRLLRRAAEDWLAEQNTVALAEAVYALFDLIERTSDGDVAAAVIPSDEADHRTYLLTAMPDSAFIVETLREAMHGRSLSIEALLHPVLVLRRSKDGRIETIHDRLAEGSRLSAVLLVLDGTLAPDEAEELRVETEEHLGLLRKATQDFHPMLDRLTDIVADLEQAKLAMSWRAPEIQEVQELLEWLGEGNFVFLGFRRYVLDSSGEESLVHVDQGSGLGILRDENRSAFSEPTPIDSLPAGLRARLVGGPLLIVSKTNALSPVHRRARMDDISIKKLGPDGQVLAERRFLGLFTAKAFAQDASQIPILRRKLREILEAEQVDRGSHDHGLIVRTFNSLPKEDLFLTPVAELLGVVDAVVEMHGTEDILIYSRPDALARGANVMVILPRRKFSGEVRQRVQEILVEAFHGHLLNYYLTIGEGEQARLHFYLASDVKDLDTIDLGAIRQAIRETVLTWGERLAVQLEGRHDRGQAAELAGRYDGSFSDEYRAATIVPTVVDDINRLEDLRSSGESQIVLAEQDPPQANKFELRVFGRGSRLVLSDVMPVLENLGFRVLEADAYTVESADADTSTIHTFEVEVPERWDVDREATEQRVSDSFLALQRGWARNLAINCLVLSAGLTWRETALLNAYAAYAFHIGAVPSRLGVRRPLVDHPRAARLLFDLFSAQFDPSVAGDREATLVTLGNSFLQYVEGVRSIEDDLTLRRLLALIHATVRTNYFQPAFQDQADRAIALKFDCSAVDFMPQPAPKFEVWVNCARTEGTHLRMREVARGGLRWSDRPEDFRTEVLGLVKTQQVKNAVIVPAGAKGAFTIADPPSDRTELAAAGIASYHDFVGALLDVTDNVVDGRIVHPADTVIRDADDPYLVVAADKGTTRFSDTANALAGDRGFWLGDAFASGGSKGYDHKKMGITARGAWECVKRHFREMGSDIQSENFVVAGIGDMSGDVFGNGMLLSRHIQLVAAFDHRHIFLDPNPDVETSWTERKRLFELSGSSWHDYDEALISDGGGVFERGEKRIPISEPMRQRLGIESTELNGNALIQAILTAPVDLLWNGGIGTYVKAEAETHAQVGDPGTDAVRVNATDLRCRVIGEGGNLGLTQCARVEFSLAGGRCNTDALDNSAGVDTSDHEVNIKILLSAAVEAGALEAETRNDLLAAVEEDVTRRVLKNSYRQSLAVTLDSFRVRERPEVFRQALTELARAGLLDRKIEQLPSTEDLVERERLGQPVLTRPELAVLLAYSKQYLKNDLLGSRELEGSGIRALTSGYFPARVVEAAGEEALAAHRLGEHIACTRLTNLAVDTMGGATLVQLAYDTGKPPSRVLKAWYVACSASTAADTINGIHALDGQVPAGVQAQWLLVVGEALERATRWLLANEDLNGDPESLIAAYGSSVSVLAGSLIEHLSDRKRREVDQRIAMYQTDGMSDDLARDLVALDYVDGLLPVAALARREEVQASRVDRIYFGLVGIIDFSWLQERLKAATSGDPWELRAARSLTLELEAVRTQIVRHLLTGPDADSERPLEAFTDRCGDGLKRIGELIEELQEEAVPGIPALMVAIHAIREECGTWANGPGNGNGTRNGWRPTQ
ncbi:MAG: NAD-glutamate dehydrogenase [Gemmatimonadota bacterium]